MEQATLPYSNGNSDLIDPLSADQAETDPQNDVLGYAPFATYLAKSIVRMTPQSGIVLGIYAPWGSGKTTLLNFVEFYLQEYSNTERPVVVHFNPWWFSGQEDLAKIFIAELFTGLGKDDKYKEARNAIAGYADLLGVIPVWGTALKEAVKVLKPKEKSVGTLKRDISTALVKAGGKILVVIDDIDRLTAEETRQLFRVIKAVADFPNVVYLLAFDRSIAAKALETVQAGDGGAYLEKIVQVPFDLPAPSETALRDMLVERLNVVLGAKHDSAFSDLFDASYWTDVYQDGIRRFIETPRDVVRLANTLSVTYSSVRGEVNPVDFIAVETLRVFASSIYNIIRSNQDMFAGTTESIEDYERKQFTEFHTEWFETIPKELKKPVKALLLLLFPKLGVAWEREIGWNRSGNPESWSRMRRIAHPSVFPTYFRLALPTDELPQSQVREIIYNIHDAAAFENTLTRLQSRVRPDGSSLARRFLERLEDYTGELQERAIPTMLQGLFDAGDILVAKEQEKRNTFWDIGMDIQIGRIIRQLLMRFDETTRFEILKNTMTRTPSYYTVADQTGKLGQQHGKYGVETTRYEPTVSVEHLDDLEQIARQKIKDNIKVADFKGRMHLLAVLHVWRETASAAEVGQWIQSVTADDTALADFLTVILNVREDDAAAKLANRSKYRLSPFWLQPFLELPEIEALRVRLSTMANGAGLTDEQHIAVLQFLQEYEDKENGSNIEDPFYTSNRSVFERYGKW